MSLRLVYVYCGSEAGQLIECSDLEVASVLQKYAPNAVDVTGANWNALPVASTNCADIDKSLLPNQPSQPTLISFAVAIGGLPPIAGGTGTASAINPQPPGASLSGVEWTTSDASKITVDRNTGALTYVAAGKATITGTIGQVSADEEVTVSAPTLTGFTVTLTAPSKEVGANGASVAASNPQPAGANLGTVTWQSSDPAKVAVNAQGALELKAEGQVTITGISGSVRETVQITVVAQTLRDFTLELPTGTLVLGGTGNARVTNPDPAGFDLSSVHFASTDPSHISIVEGTGAMSYDGVGDATISATVEGITKRNTLTVTQPALTDYSLSVSAEPKVVGGTAKVTPTNPVPAQAGFTTPTWTSSAENIVRVTAGTGNDRNSGMLEYRAKGTATITCRIGTIEKTVQIVVAAAPATSFDVSIPAGDKEVGGAHVTATLTNVLPAGASTAGVQWTSADPAKVQIDASSGEMTFLGAGTVQITATLGSGGSAVSANANVVVVEPALTSFTVTISNDPTAIGGTGTATATGAVPAGAAGRLSTVTWASNHANIVGVNAQGHLEYKAEGTARITGTVGSVTAYADITVTKPLVTSYNIASSGTPTVVGQTPTFRIENVSPANGDISSLTFESSDPSVVRIDDAATGTATYLAGGDAEIHAKIGNLDEQVGVHVLDASFTIRAPSAPVHVGDSVTLHIDSANKLPTNLNEDTIIWATTADASVATITSAGVLTAIGIGSAPVTASVGNFSAPITLNIIAAP